MKIKALLIDDEEKARNTLSSLLSAYCAEVEIIATSANVPDGVIAINQYKPELVFLDVEMPFYNGFELLKFFEKVDFEIIFVTAYSEHAIKAFEVSAIDYILKPIDIDQLVQAVEKFKEKRNLKNADQRLHLMQENLNSAEIKRIALPMNDGLVFLELKDIVVFQADGAYTHVHLENGSKILVSKKLKFFEDLLVGRPLFFRTHRSHIINLNFVQKYLKGEGTILMDGQHLVSVSREKKQEFERMLKELKIS
ncbi:MAG: LytTR family DNA-binding domain-containing protein [Crocinitomicaceae bacterium]